MSARDDYTRAPLTQATYEAMCNEIDALREANHQWLMSAMDSNRRDECFAKKYHGTPAIEGRHSAHSFSYGTESRYTGHCAGREG